MKHTTRYEGSESEKIQNALNDIKSYIGIEKFQLIFDEVKKLPHTKEMINTLRMQFAFIAGIEGFPVIAIIASAWEMSTDDIYSLLEKTEN